ncbi:hypothetical protein GCM10022276_26500 [Sphingomonas limnosediminicola]|jgi:hypothetical protein|uniref:Uncharacterized protein n=1 Tax=Sphingomonas limnosediminicola TaxID=940133 RepID=A0ABP7LVK6_9SPHN
MKSLIALGAAALVATVAPAPAQAREGCGRDFHRTPNGMCRANKGTHARYMEGRYYAGQGYWYRNGWYHRRHRHNGIWIYSR